ncbi:MAG: polysaccharide deacetylase family protein [Omnitrophica WOR_2 bacterium]
MVMHGLETLAKAIPTPVYRSLVRRDLYSFFYHVVSDEYLPHIHHLYPYKSSSQFEADLIYLRDHFHPVSYPQLNSRGKSQGDVEPGSVLLSFDDGCAECYSVVRPRLLKYAIPCVFFITTSLIDNQSMLYRHKASLCIERITSAEEGWRQAKFTQIGQAFSREILDVPSFIRWLKMDKTGEAGVIEPVSQMLEIDLEQYLSERRPYLTRDEICSLAEDGFTIGAHSVSHAKLSSLTPAGLEAEIAGSCQVIQEITGQEQVPFAFPFSAYGADRRLLAEIAVRHPEIGMLFDSKGIREEKGLLLNRIWADPVGKQAGQTNIPQLLRSAYEDNFVWKTRQLRLNIR